MKTRTYYLTLFFLVTISLVFSCKGDEDSLFEVVNESVEDTIDENEDFETNETTSDDSEQTSDDNEDSSNEDENSEDSVSDESDSSDGALNFSSFGAIGDGQSDDSDAIQEAFNSGENLIANQGSVFLVSKTIEVTVSATQNINWNSSTVTSNTSLSTFMTIEKTQGVLKMNDLVCEGNSKIAVAFRIESPVEFDNINWKDLYSETQSVIGIRMEITEDSKTHGDSSFKNCDCSNVAGKIDNDLGNVVGASRCMFFRWKYTNTPITITIDGGIWDGAWGDDGDLLHYEQSVESMNDCKMLINGTQFKNFSRRAGKILGGSIEFNNCLFVSTRSDDPRLTSIVPTAGMLALATSGSYKDVSGMRFRECTFDNTNDFEGRLVFIDQTDVELTGNIFRNAWIVFSKSAGDFVICDNTFDGGSIYEFGEPDYFGNVKIGANNGVNIYLEDQDWERIDCD